MKKLTIPLILLLSLSIAQAQNFSITCDREVYYCLKDCEAICNFTSYIGTQTVNVSARFGNSLVEPLSVSELRNISYNKTVWDWGNITRYQTCDSLASINSTHLNCTLSNYTFLVHKSNESIPTCFPLCWEGYNLTNKTYWANNWEVVGNHTEAGWKLEWVELNSTIEHSVPSIRTEITIGSSKTLKFWFRVPVNSEGKFNISLKNSNYFESLDPWWSSKWKYRRKIVITEQSGKSLANFQVLIRFNYTTKMREDLGDIRFLLDNQELPYWIENYTNPLVWVKVPQIPAYGKVTLYLYYGNPNALGKSDAERVFDLFEDWNGTSINLTRWEAYRCPSTHCWVNNSKLYMKNPGDWWLWYKSHRALRLKEYYENATVEIKGRVPELNPNNENYHYGIHAWRNGEAIDCMGTKCAYGITLSQELGYEEYHAEWIGGVRGRYRDKHEPQYRILRAKLSSSITKWEVDWINRSSIWSLPENEWYYPSYKIGVAVKEIGTEANSIFEVDWLLVRKYADPEPAYSIGAEEELAPPPPIYKTLIVGIGSIVLAFGGIKFMLRLLGSPKNPEDITEMFTGIMIILALIALCISLASSLL
ncbi:hypothetical protein DRH14_04965 [Candidatus Shapirobacteria bacterium]|nr:MAG: hypothetical protein DRH14_04965 [Candidatus Shapirobacteria bacterium]